MVVVSINGGASREAVETRGFERATLSKVVYTDVGDVAVCWDAKNQFIRRETCRCPCVVPGYCVLGWLSRASTPIVQGRVRTRGVCSYGFTMR